jgi:hypothetical protein
MVSNGRVIGGHYLNATVATVVGSALVVQAGFKWRKLNEENVVSWTEVPTDAKSGTVSLVGQAVAGAVLPRLISKSASAAVGATLDATMRKPHHVHVDWEDGKESLIKLPEDLFTHFALMLKGKQVVSIEPAPTAAELANEPIGQQTLAEQALTHLSDLIKDRLPEPASRKAKPVETTNPAQLDVMEQLTKLSALHDAGIITADEFAAKKTELLARL